MSSAPASYALAEEFTVIPFPFVGKEREQLEAEYALLLEAKVSHREITDMILWSIEILLNKRKKAKDEKTYEKITWQLSDMLGRLVVFEEMFVTRKVR